MRPATAKKPATVTPKTHTARAIFLHNVLTAIWWLACTYLLIASHIPALPPHKALAKALTRKNATKPLMPVYGLVALAYVGLGLLQSVLQFMGDQLPRKVAFLARTVRKENARMAEHYLPFSTSSCFLGIVPAPAQDRRSSFFTWYTVHSLRACTTPCSSSIIPYKPKQHPDMDLCCACTHKDACTALHHNELCCLQLPQPGTGRRTHQDVLTSEQQSLQRIYWDKLESTPHLACAACACLPSRWC